MIRTQVSFEEKMYREAKAEALRRGISFAELCRRAIAGMLRSRAGERPWMRYAGIVQSGDPEASRSVDQVVYVRETP
jgi:hypothetical protein